MKYKPPGSGPPIASTLAAASAANAQGRLAEAEAFCRKALTDQPQNLDAMLMLGGIAVRTGRQELAHDLFRETLRLKPDSVQALVRLAGLLSISGKPEEATGLCQRALALAPDSADAYTVLATCCIDLWRIPEAIDALQRAIELRPGFAPVYERLAHALALQGRNAESIEAYRRAIHSMPDALNCYVQLGTLLQQSGASNEAEQIFACAEARASKSLAQLTELARAFGAVGNTLREETAARRAVQLAPKAEEPQLLLSQIFQDSGRFDEAAAILKAALAMHPGSFRLYHRLIYGEKVTQAEMPIIDSMKLLLQQGSLGLEGQSQIHYALGKAYDDLGEYGHAIPHFREANRTALASMPPPHPQQRAADKAMIDTMIATFTRDYFKRTAIEGSDSEEPVFIIGMPRSGTTLIEQILSSHPLIGAVGESTYLGNSALKLLSPTAPPRQEAVTELAEGYLRFIRSGTHGERRITDKLPANFKLAGLIHVIFPKARFIHCRRNPIDNCLSVYVTPIVLDSSHTFQDIAYAHREYQRLMAHWRQVLPSNRFLEVDYEEVVANREPVERRLIEFLDLPWDDAVLSHEANTRTVHTPSRWQVRQPIYTGSVERWRRYEPWIGELLHEFPELVGKQ